MEKSTYNPDQTEQSATMTNFDVATIIPRLIQDLESDDTNLHVLALRELLKIILDNPENKELASNYKLMPLLNKFAGNIEKNEEFVLSTTIQHVIGVRNGSDDKMILAGAATDSIIQTIFSPDENTSKSGSITLSELIKENEIIRNSLITSGFIQKVQHTFAHCSQSSSSSQTQITTPYHVKSGILDIILKLIETIDDFQPTAVLIPILTDLKNNGEKEIKNQSISILAIQRAKGINASSSSNSQEKDEQIKQLKEGIEREKAEKERKEEELQRERIRADKAEQRIGDLEERIELSEIQCSVLVKIAEELKQPLEEDENEEDTQYLIQNQENDCKLLTRTFENNDEDIEGRKRLIKAGITDLLLHIFKTRKLDLITRQYTEAFFNIVNISNCNNICLSLLDKKPFPCLIRLFDHNEDNIAIDALGSIIFILVAGAESTEDSEIHPQYEAMDAAGGIEKIYEVFKKNRCSELQDRSAVCIGYLFRAREITDIVMLHSITNHLKSLLIDDDDDDDSDDDDDYDDETWIQDRAIDSLKYLAQNQVNRSQILKTKELNKIESDLDQELEGDEEEQQSILHNQKTDLLLISTILDGPDDDELLKRIISSGIIENIIFIFNNRDLNSISRAYSKTFFDLIISSNDKSTHLIYNKNPYPGLIRLLDHSDDLILGDVVASIFHILQAGSDTTPETEPHPHYEIIQEYDGINKIIALFQKNAKQYCKDRAAICIGYLFKAREITDSQMRQDIFNHLKSLLSDSDDWVKERAKDALKHIVQNDANRSEIMKNFDYNAIANNLQKELKGSEQENKEIIQKQEFDCLLFYSLLCGRVDFQLRRDAINTGIVDMLFQIFASRDLDGITKPYTRGFFVFTYPYSFPVSQLLIEKQPFPSLLRLLVHQNEDIVSNIIASIDNILYAGAIGTELTSLHPYFTNLASADGIEKIYTLFKRSTHKFNKKVSAICLGIAFRAQEIKDSHMRKDIIAHLKSIIHDPDEETRNEVRLALKCLSQNQVNKVEIEKDGFTNPE
ncbi:MAG: hypothetical protein EZS28_024569 [Streblomastix strix]|uniref:Uncharacterized protein n=1 Tax=Streblomastix strix TaxID=222440 RepID=A0A5J4VBR4_9EUKA|nr:MAG: hypothetical protein EZS28_024569 [Streblomastix strix]